jgi:predicted glycosyltransferase involved in capsule biosynthesis
VIVEEDDSSKVHERYKNIMHVFMKKQSPLFNRTRLVNTGAHYVKTESLCLLDMDVFLDPEKYIEAIDYLKDYSLVYPFNGMFYDIPQRYNQNKALRTSDIAGRDKKLLNRDSVGGLQFIRTEDFFDGGMTNELIRGWGFEDNEFYARFEKLGCSIKRMDNPIYHFTHPRNFNSDGRSPHIHENERVYEKVKNMTKEELSNYISKSFYWCTT